MLEYELPSLDDIFSQKDNINKLSKSTIPNCLSNKNIMPHAECTTISYFENHIPSFVGHELDRLYGARYASLAFFRIYGDAEGASTYVARRNGEASAVFLFKCDKGRVNVLNEGVQISQVEAARFADCLFSKSPSVNAIRFNYVETEAEGFIYPYFRMCCEEDLVLNLPDTVEQYMASLGKSTRANLKNRLNKIKRDFPSFAISVYEKDEVKEEDIREIVRLNRLRMTNKNKTPAIDDDEEKRIILCVKECGFVCIATIDGRICAGSLAFRFGQNYTGRILAHDPAYDNHSLGFVCAFLSMCECVKKKGSERFYFGWGDNDYKQRLGGKPRQLSRLIIYRSWLHVFPNAWPVLNTLIASTRFHLRQKMLDSAKRDGKGISYLTNQLIKAVRWIKTGKAKLLANR